MSAPPAGKLIPYPGPAAFTAGEAPFYFGREAEVAKLRSLVVARRAVLLFAPSGAGKTSLLAAGLLPGLAARTGIVALPRARVGAPIPAGAANAAHAAHAADTAGNPFVRSIVCDLLRDEPGGGPGGELGGLTLAAGLARYLAAEPAAQRDQPHLLLLDPFEEVFTAYSASAAEQAGFFAQLAQALDQLPQVKLLLAMREDFLGQLEPYLPQLPDRLRSRLRLSLLGTAAAREAIARPAEEAGCPFAEAALAALVDDLRRVRQPRPGGAVGEGLGEEVEPVQLQVVCRRLWARRDPEAREIDGALLAAAGSVDSALAGFYAAEVAAAAAAAGMAERRLRGWIGNRLVTSGGLRSQVLAGTDAAQEVADAALRLLVDAHVLRAEERRGLRWYELAHDRLVSPVLVDNAAWAEENVPFWERRAAEWQAEGRHAALLLTGDDLAVAQRLAAADPSLEPDETAFLAACQEAGEAARRARRMRWWAWAASALAVVLVGLFFFYRSLMFDERQFRTRQMALSSLAHAALDERQDLALHAALALYQSEPGSHLASQFLLFAGLEGRPHFAGMLHGGQGGVLAVAYSPDGQRLASAGEKGTVKLWNAESGAAAGEWTSPIADELEALAWSRSGRLAVAGRSGAIWVWPPGAAQPAALAAAGGPPASGLAWSPDGGTLYGAADDGRVHRWDGSTGVELGSYGETATRLTGVAASPDGKTVAAAGADGKVRWWNTGSGVLRCEAWSDGLNALAYDPSGRWLAAVGFDEVVHLWEVSPAAGRECPGAPQLLEIGLGELQSLAWSEDGRFLAVGAADGTIAVREWAKARAKARDREKNRLRWVDHPWRAAGPLHGLSFRPDGQRLASGSGEQVALWDPRPEARRRLVVTPLPDGLRTAELAGQARSSERRACAPKGQPCAEIGPRGVSIAGRDGGPAPSQPAIPFRPAAVAWSHDGSLLAVAGIDGNVQLWDTRTWERYPGLLRGDGQPVTGLVFLPGPARLLTLSRGEPRRLWDLDPRSWRERACRLAGGTLSEAERKELDPEPKEKGLLSKLFIPRKQEIATGCAAETPAAEPH